IGWQFGNIQPEMRSDRGKGQFGGGEMLQFIPYQACGKVRFGMSQEEVQKTLGQPNLVRRNWLGHKELIYDLFNIGFGDVGAVLDITLYPEASVVLDGVEIMSLPSGRQYLLHRSKEKYVGDGSIIWLDLGVAISEDEEPESAETITVFARGWFEEQINEYARLP